MHYYLFTRLARLFYGIGASLCIAAISLSLHYQPVSAEVVPQQPGLGNCGSGYVAKVESKGDIAVYNGSVVIGSIIVKAGSQNQGDACTEFSQDGNNGCYAVSGLGTTHVTVKRVGSGPGCKGISHVEFYAAPAHETDIPATKPAATATATPTATSTATATETPATATATQRPTKTATNTPRPTRTATAKATWTATATATILNTPEETAQVTATETAQATATATNTAIATATIIPGSTDAPTPTLTFTPTAAATSTLVSTATGTPASIPPLTSTPTPTATQENPDPTSPALTPTAGDPGDPTDTPGDPAQQETLVPESTATPPPTLPPPAAPTGTASTPVLIPETGVDFTGGLLSDPALPNLLLNLGIGLIGLGLVLQGAAGKLRSR